MPERLTPTAPNVLWVVTTQWRAQACGYAGDPNACTPCLDALAGEAINYTQAVTPHPFGPFARAALLTGKLSPENGISDYYDALPDQAQTIAHAMRAQGYATAFFGKWHLAARDREAPLVGEAHAKVVVPEHTRGGFQHWEGFEGGFMLNDPFLHGADLPEPIQFLGYQSEIVCQRARAWMARAGPWFCVVSLEPPHPPYDAPSAGIVPRTPESIVLRPNVPRGGAVEERARRELAGYYAHIEATDGAIGRLLHGLPKETTAVVFTSVHGDMHGAHGLFRKGWPYEESVRVPLLVRSPAEPAREVHSHISLLNLVRMTQRWAAGAGREPLPRESVISMPSVVRLPHQCDRIWRGVRTSERKLVMNEDGSPWLFFDLERDPFEMENLVSDASRRAERDELQSRIDFPHAFQG